MIDGKTGDDYVTVHTTTCLLIVDTDKREQTETEGHKDVVSMQNAKKAMEGWKDQHASTASDDSQRYLLTQTHEGRFVGHVERLEGLEKIVTAWKMQGVWD